MEEVFLDGLNVQFHCLLFCRICVSYMLHRSHRTPKVDWTFIKIFFFQHCVDSFNINTNKWVLRSVNIISSTEPVPWILLVLAMSKASLVEYSVIKLPPLPSRVVFREAFEQALLGAAAGATKRRTSRSSSWRVMRACLMFAKDLRFFWN